MDSFFVGLLASLIGSVAWYFALRKGNEIYNKCFVFDKIVGVYDHKSVKGEPIENYSVIEFEPPNILSIKTRSKDKTKNDWDGTVVMDEYRPRTGEGTFEYLERESLGKIFIQIMDDKEIFVRSTHLETANTKKVAYFMEPQGKL
ncbi:hypothetical protein NC796_12135 [Aliifodinibius sp. S!AR15-10]|uniref:hypothetical protein n=1 Tax=Aliifodinibius sp. S!AR15-10 TaxID=2950437 RepID=UPI0028581083|nr:hypothetical protein [Aliifodinibius sp. S!AR15-10]MDR8391898.1 hypothetical protein [Aliifodinibius sp. S!AR15-10]